MCNLRLDTIDIGSIVQSLLLPSQLPTNPDRTWRGRVEKITRSASNSIVGACWIRSIEPGYEGLEEHILFDQIVSIEEYVICQDC